MGATQFRLLCTLGLRAGHRLLDFGCGSLRAGRLFICYLDEGCYYGVEPNRWLIQDAIQNQVGEDLIRIKKPSFDYNDSFGISVFLTRFDFILAQSIFSHTGSDLVNRCLHNFSESLKEDGIIAATFVEGNTDFESSGWVYPKCVTFRKSTIEQLAKDAGLVTERIPWHHPRQAWYVFAKTRDRLPSRVMRRYLKGAVLFDSEFTSSWKMSTKICTAVLNFAKSNIPLPLKKLIKAAISRGNKA
jgi:cyclopropane fatty-acyl-phospholipid synthase-like methyltransferase